MTKIRSERASGLGGAACRAEGEVETKGGNASQTGDDELRQSGLMAPHQADTASMKQCLLDEASDEDSDFKSLIWK